MTDLDPKTKADTESMIRWFIGRTLPQNPTTIAALRRVADEAEGAISTDLDRLKATFDAIGVKYALRGDRLLCIPEDPEYLAGCLEITFVFDRDGKFVEHEFER